MEGHNSFGQLVALVLLNQVDRRPEPASPRAATVGAAAMEEAAAVRTAAAEAAAVVASSVAGAERASPDAAAGGSAEALGAGRTLGVAAEGMRSTSLMLAVPAPKLPFVCLLVQQPPPRSRDEQRRGAVARRHP